MSSLRCTLMTLAVVIAPWSSAHAADVTWLNPVSGNWTDGSKWSTGAPPAAGDNVFITMPGTYTVSLGSNTQVVNAVAIGGGPGDITLATTDRTLRSSGVVIVGTGGRIAGHGFVELLGGGGRLVVNGGTLETSGNLEIYGTLEFVSGSITTSGTLLVTLGALVLTNPLDTAANLNIYDTTVSGMTLTSHGTITGGITARFLCPVINAPTGFMSIATGNTLQFEHPSGLLNEGAITIGGLTPLGTNTLSVLNGPLTNRGTINTRNSSHPVSIIAELINEPGAVFENMASASLLLGRTGAQHINRGAFRNVTSVTQSAGGTFRQESGVFAHSGACVIEGGSLLLLGGSVTGGFSLNTALLDLGISHENLGTITVNDSMVSGMTLTNRGTLTGGVSARFLCPVINAPTGFISVQTGNGPTDYRFEHAGGLVNEGTITAGSSGNGTNTLTIPNGPFINRGLFNTRDSRGMGITVVAELINEPGATFENMAGATLHLGRTGAQHINRGTIRNLATVTQSPAGMFTQEAGAMVVTSDTTVEGGGWTYLSGDLSGAGTLRMLGVQIDLASPYANNITLNITETSTVGGMTLTNNALLSDFGNGANPVFNCPVVNGPAGTIAVRTGNSGGVFRFNHAQGLVNLGTVSIGSSGNGANQLLVPNGPFTNSGMVSMQNSRGFLQSITARVVNEPTGQIIADLAPLNIGFAGAAHVNRGRIETRGGGLNIVLPGGSSLTNESTGVIQAVTDGSTLDFSTDDAPHAGPWLVNRGLIESLGLTSSLNIVYGDGRRFDNESQGTVRSMGGQVSIGNGGATRNDGSIEVEPGGRVRVIGTAPENYDATNQRWRGGRLRVHGPGEFCTILSTPLHRVDFNLECLHEPGVCTIPGGTPGLFGQIEEIEQDGSFLLDDMDMTTAGDLVVNGTAMFVNGARLTTPGALHSNGTIVIHNSTIIPNSVLIGNGQFVGAGEIQGRIVNNGGRVRPGQSPGRLQTTSDYLQGPLGSLEIELSGTVPGLEHDVLAAGPTAALDGSLEVVLINGFSPSRGDQYVIVQAAQVTGRFAGETLPPGLYVEYRAGEVRVFRPCAADWNHNNLTSVQDLFDFLASYFAGDGDFNDSGGTSVQDIFDYLGAFFGEC